MQYNAKPSGIINMRDPEADSDDELPNSDGVLQIYHILQQIKNSGSNDQLEPEGPENSLTDEERKIRPAMRLSNNTSADHPNQSPSATANETGESDQLVNTNGSTKDEDDEFSFENTSAEIYEHFLRRKEETRLRVMELLEQDRKTRMNRGIERHLKSSTPSRHEVVKEYFSPWGGYGIMRVVRFSNNARADTEKQFIAWDPLLDENQQIVSLNEETQNQIQKMEVFKVAEDEDRPMEEVD